MSAGKQAKMLTPNKRLPSSRTSRHGAIGPGPGDVSVVDQSRTAGQRRLPASPGVW